MFEKCKERKKEQRRKHDFLIIEKPFHLYQKHFIKQLESSNNYQREENN